MLVNHLSSLNSIVDALPITVAGAESVCDMMSKAVSVDVIVSTADFDLLEVTTDISERVHVIQGSVTGESVIIRLKQA